MTQDTQAPPDTRIALLSIALICVLSTFATGCGGGAPADQDVAKGKAVYDRVCATCHRQDASGIPGLGKGLRDNELIRSQSDRELVEFLKVGRPATHPLNTTGIDMPPKGGDPTIDDQDLENLVAFLKTL